MGTGFSKKKKEARMLQEQFSKMQDQLKTTQVTGKAANGLVAITLNGDHEMISIKIKPECVDPEDVEGLEDLIKQAYQDACQQLKKTEMPSMPGMPKMPGFPGMGEGGPFGLNL